MTDAATSPAVWIIAAAALACRVALGLLLLRAAAGKALDLARFVAVIRTYRLLPDILAAPAATVLTGVELMLACLLLSSRQTMATAIATAALLAVFAAAMALNLRRGRGFIACGCGLGAAHDRLSWRGTLATLALVPAALLSSQPWPGGGALLLAQSMMAGLLLFTLHEAATGLGAIRLAAPNSTLGSGPRSAQGSAQGSAQSRASACA